MQIEIMTSGIWQTNSTIIEHEGICLVVDPAYFPRELDAIAACTKNRQIQATVFTHGHWDHVMGHTAIDAPVWLSSTLEQSIVSGDPRAATYLDDAREFDSRWYVVRPHGHHWPEHRRGLANDETFDLAGAPIRVLHLPGHSPDGLGLVVGDVLLVGDYLSPCEIPFVDDAVAYVATLRRLSELIAEGRAVIPGHGRRLSPPEALAIAREDVSYLEGLIAAGAARSRELGHALQLPRAAKVVGMRDHHLDNCAKVGLSR